MVGRASKEDEDIKFMVRAIAVLGGMASAIIALLLELPGLLSLSNNFLSVYLIFGLLPAVIEEPFKQLGLALIAYKQPRWIPSKRDAVIAGALAGLAFGILEALFAFMGGAGLERLPVIMVHTGASAVGGLGMYHACKREYGSTALWIGAAVGIHFHWNSIMI